MKKFTNLLLENETKKYFEILATINLIVEANSEGEAGYLGDSILGGIEEQSDFIIQNISEISEKDFKKQFESVQTTQWNETGGYLQKSFEFKDFKEALAFINKVGAIAESEGHHPDIHLVDYKFVNIDLSTHAIGGLSQNDFIVAAKINAQ